MIYPAQIAAIIPAAGFSSRYPGDLKLLETLGDITVIEQVVRIARIAGITEILVITGHGREKIEETMLAVGVCTVFNPEFGTGMGSSIATGVKHAPDSAGYLVWPGDMPGIMPRSIRALIDSSVTGSIIVPVFKRRRGHPVLFSDAFFSDLSRLNSDEGARCILEANPSCVVEVDVDDPGIHLDIDTKENLATFYRLAERGNT